MLLRAECLCREARGAHTDKGAVPVDEVEYRNTYRERTYRGRSIATRHATCDKGRGDAHQRNGDVRDDVWYGYS